MGYDPKIWGAQAWHFIHMTMINFPPESTGEDKKEYEKFIDSIPHILPCPMCGEHFKEILKTHQPDYKDAQSMWKWSVDVHNEVNKSLDKPVLSYDEAWAELKKNGEPVEATPRPNYNVEYFLAGIGIFAFAMLIFGGSKK